MELSWTNLLGRSRCTLMCLSILVLACEIGNA